MKIKLPHLERRFARHMAHSAADLPQLEREIDHLGGTAESDLHHRLHHVEVMEQALRRNVEEVLHAETPVPRRVRKLRRLCQCIEKETENLRHEVEFLGMGSGSTIVALVNSSNHVLERWARKVSKMRPRQRPHS